MIFEKQIEDEYYRWFAWYPVKLAGPDEWKRMKMKGCYARIVWLRFVWRMRCKPNTYYTI